MPKRARSAASPLLTEAEIRLMNILWQRGTATVQEVRDALQAEVPLAYSTVLTMLRILERKGYLTHTKRGRAYVYRPVVPPQKVRRRVLRYIVQRFFDRSPRLLLLHLLQDTDLSEADLEELRRLLATSRREKAP